MFAGDPIPCGWCEPCAEGDAANCAHRAVLCARCERWWTTRAAGDCDVCRASDGESGGDDARE